MKPAMLDTDVLSAFLRGEPKVIARADAYLKEHGTLSLSVITYYEVRNGLLYKDALKQMERFETFVALNNELPLTLEAARTAANVQAELRKKGAVIGHTDTLIAGVAMSLGLQLVTNNTDHFKRVKGLDLANWTK
jgi:tRNA(fMet)-specific endonuclease VapC